MQKLFIEHESTIFPTESSAKHYPSKKYCSIKPCIIQGELFKKIFLGFLLGFAK